MGLKHFALVPEKSSPDSRSLSFHQDEQFRAAPLRESDADKSISVASGDSLHKLFLHPHYLSTAKAPRTPREMGCRKGSAEGNADAPPGAVGSFGSEGRTWESWRPGYPALALGDHGGSSFSRIRASVDIAPRSGVALGEFGARP